MNQFRVPNRLKAIKKTSSDLLGSFNIKKIRNLYESCFFAFLSHLETRHLSYRGSVKGKTPLQSDEAQ